MHLLAQQPYIKVQRENNGLEQWDVEEQRMLYLYDDKVVTEHREFPIADVADVSYRQMGEEGGMLYLHTMKGVYTYIVKSEPQKFMHVFRDEIKAKRY